MNNNSKTIEISLAISLIPIIYLVFALSINVYVFGDNGLSGSNQLVILSAAAVAAILAIIHGVSWDKVQKGVQKNIHTAAVPLLILLFVGALTGTWLVSGIVPILIYYGLQIIAPEIFLPASVIICALISIASGSSWTTSATIGIALMGIGIALGLNPALIAGAVISGSYFGDKMSPMSDTTNLAASVANIELFTHIRYMSLTTLPSILVSLVIFLVLGLTQDIGNYSAQTEAILATLNQQFNLNPLVLIAPMTVLVMVIRRTAALPAIFLGVILGAILAVIFQPELVHEIGTKTLGGSDGFTYYAGIAQVMFGDVAIATDNDILNDLLSSGGMGGMLNTIWLVLTAMSFGGVMEASGMLTTITNAILRTVKSAVSLVVATVSTCFLTNISASDQYIALILPGKMFPESFEKLGLAPENLSRTLEDSGTVTSVLIPWNTCGAYHASVLGVATFSYLPYCFFNLISPVMTILFAVFGIKIARLAINNRGKNKHQTTLAST